MSGMPQRPPGPPPVRPPPGAPPIAGLASVPQRPPGAPPVRPPVDTTIRGIGEIKRPPGPPPGNVPITALKPPPIAPPPRNLVQAAQRPPVESIRAIVAPRPPTKPSAPTPSQPVAMDGKTLTPVGSMPRVVPPSGVPMDLLPEFEPPKVGLGSLAIRGAAAPKFSAAARPAGAAWKPGAIPMFQPDEEAPQEPADKKQKVAAGGGRTAAADKMSPAPKPPRPQPPPLQPAGIPEGEPVPPDTKAPKEVNPPAPVKPVPNRNRAPPKEEPEGFRKPIPGPAPPNSEPPFLRKKKEKVEVIVPRRDKDMPEFESSSEEEGEDGVRRKKVKQQPQQERALSSSAWVAEKKDQIPAFVDATSTPFSPDRPVARPAAAGDWKTAATPARPGGDFMGPDKPPLPASPPPVSPREETSVMRPVTGEFVRKKSIEERELESERLLKEAQKEAAKKAQRRGSIPAWGAEEAPKDLVKDEPVPPMTAPMVAAAAAAAAAATAEPQSTIEDLRLARELPKGRLSIKCIEGQEFRKKDDVSRNPRTDPFLRFRLGAAEKHPWKTTEVKKKQNTNPKFDNEVVFFNVVDAADFVIAGDLHLTIEVWNKGAVKDEMMGTVTMSAVRFMRTPFVVYEERVPMYLPGQQLSKSKLVLEFVYEEARSGIAEITLFEARGLRNIDPMGQQDPYVQFTLGEGYVKRSRTVKNGGTKPYFAEEQLLLWVNQDNWVGDLKVSVLDDDMGQDKAIGYTHFSLLQYMNQKNSQEDAFDLFYTTKADAKDDSLVKEVAQGQLMMRVRFYPAGKMLVRVERAKNLKYPDSHIFSESSGSRIDPYACLTLDGKAIRAVKRTPADKDGGSSPYWGMDLNFDVVDQYNIEIDVFHQNMQGSDVLLGSTQVPLLSAFRQGNITSWYTLKQKKSNGGTIEQGDIQLNLLFSGPPGIAFPQMRPEVTSFDDGMRAPAPKPQIMDQEPEEPEPAQPISTIPEKKTTEELEREKQKEKEKTASKYTTGVDELLPPEFTDEEIIAAFKFIDLDHNNFIGAKEIRHILICMGELITDEEIDMMISMVDQDGDGQVSFVEFRTLVLHPTPHLADLHKEVLLRKTDIVARDRVNVAAPTSQGLDFNAYQRQKEMTKREAKKKMLVAFVSENEVNLDYVKNAYQQYLDLPLEQRIGGRVNFEDFCHSLSVEPIAEYRRLHALFDAEEKGDVDFREILLSMMNFIEVDKELRVRFSFTMFDEMKTGYISHKEVEEILRGNHMISLSSVQRKADTIMRQAKATSTGSITMNEFVIVSKKFPNILLPSLGVTSQNQRPPN